MSVQGVSSSTNPYLSNVQSNTATLSSEFKSLVTAIQSGDLKSAQNAFSQIQSLMKSSQSAQAVTAVQPSTQQSELNADFTALGNALQSGDLNGAQDALKKLGQDVQSTSSTGKAHHHHHHHGGKSPSDAIASSTTVSSAAAANGSAGSSGNNLNILV
jgi:DNA-binding FadR family transcriptional regulator